MAKNIVICCDGTGNQVGNTLSNVLKFFRILRKNEHQRVYYNPGVGTIGQKDPWQRLKQDARGVFGLATGYGLDDDVLNAYRFLSQTYNKDDKVWLFGFSRGAYTVRVLAAFLHVIGLLSPDQLNLAGYAFAAFKKSSADSRRAQKKDGDAPDTSLDAAWHFSRVAGGKAPSLPRTVPKAQTARNQLAARLSPDPLQVNEAKLIQAWLAEKPGLPHPYHEDPENLFAWNVVETNGEVHLVEPKNASLRSKNAVHAAVECLGLNRETLLKLRYAVYVDLLFTLLTWRSGDATSRQRADTQLQHMCSAQRQFAGMCRYFCRLAGRTV